MPLPQGTWERRGPASEGAPIIIFVRPFQPQAQARPVASVAWSGDPEQMRTIADLILVALAGHARPSQPPAHDKRG